MGSHNKPLSAQIPQMQPLQQLGFPGSFWPLSPSQVMFNPWMAHQCPAIGPMLPPQHQNSVLQTTDASEQPPWFQALVAAVSTEIKNNGKKEATGDADKKADPTRPPPSTTMGDLSPEDEKVLLNALKKRNESGLTVQQVFRELSQNHGHEEIVWKMWFIANFEKLYPDKLDSTGPLSVDGPSGPVCQAGASAWKLSSSNHSSRSLTTTAINERGRSSGESERSESELSDDEDLPTSCNTSHPHPPSSRKKAPIQRIPVTKADLRAMALYICEKGDFETRHYRRSCWREFAERPQNHKRSLDAWTGVPRITKHAHEIDRLVKQYQNEAVVANSRIGLPVHPQQSRSGASSSGVPRKHAGVNAAIDLTAEIEE